MNPSVFARRLRQPSSANSARGRRFVIVAAQFNRQLTQALVRGAAATLRQAGVRPEAIKVEWVAGAFELPVMAARAVKAHPRPDAVIALGVLIRGQTVQYEVIANAVAQGLTRVAVASAIPVTFGVIVAETAAQAKARAGGKQGNRGSEAAEAALSVFYASAGGPH